MGCFKLFDRKIVAHTFETICIVVIVCIFLLLRVLMSCFMAREMRENQQKKKSEMVWAKKMNVQLFYFEK